MAEPRKRLRLDQLLVERGHYATRSRARDAIARGTVRVDGVVVDRAGLLCAPGSTIEIEDPARAYVSRASLKLKGALNAFDIPVAGKVCLDLGASTGGFTQVLLEMGAARVHAIDVGHGQMDVQLRADKRIRVTEGLNARDLTADALEGDQPDIVVCDVSFISLTLALPAALWLAAPGAHLVALVKPQFEVGRARIGRGGLVAPDVATRALRKVVSWLDAQPGWAVRQTIPSPVKGGDGNQEFLLWARKDQSSSLTGL